MKEILRVAVVAACVFAGYFAIGHFFPASNGFAFGVLGLGITYAALVGGAAGVVAVKVTK